MSDKRIGILTGGGDCPGLNAAIRAVVRRAPVHGLEVLGVRRGWRGLIEKDVVTLDLDAISGLLPRGGTILKTSRTNPYRDESTRARLLENVRSLGISGVVAIGGEDTLGVAARLHQDGVRVVGVPKTIDNDIRGTDQTFGFDTAVSIACEAIDRLHTTAESHERVMIVEVMGRASGWIAAASGVASGADAILVPEFPLSVEEIVELVARRRARGRDFSIVVVAEGAPLHVDGRMVEVRSDEVDAFGHPRLGGVGNLLAGEIGRRTGHDARVTILGHVQRGGTPTAYDRLLATRMGAFACDLIGRGESGVMAALRGTRMEAVPLDVVAGGIRPLDPALWDLARSFFG